MFPPFNVGLDRTSFGTSHVLNCAMHTNLAHGSSGSIHVLLRYLKDPLAGISVPKPTGGRLKPRGCTAPFNLRCTPCGCQCIEASAARQRHFGLPISCGLVLSSLMACGLSHCLDLFLEVPVQRRTGVKSASLPVA